MKGVVLVCTRNKVVYEHDLLTKDRDYTNEGSSLGRAIVSLPATW